MGRKNLGNVSIQFNRKFEKLYERNKKKSLEALGVTWQSNVVDEIDTAGKMLPIRNIIAGSAVDTGEMRASNEYQVEPHRDSVLVGNTSPHGIYVTMGTWKMPARPFFQRSLTEYDDEYMKMLANVLGRGMG